MVAGSIARNGGPAGRQPQYLVVTLRARRTDIGGPRPQLERRQRLFPRSPEPPHALNTRLPPGAPPSCSGVFPNLSTPCGHVRVMAAVPSVYSPEQGFRAHCPPSSFSGGP